MLSSYLLRLLGYWLHVLLSDTSAIKVGFELCLTQITNQSQMISSIKLQPILSRLAGPNQTRSLIRCDTTNRAHSAEWLTYSRLQVGDILGSESIMSDLYLADQQSVDSGSTYIQSAYLSRTHMLIELFHWFPYSERFVNISQRLYQLDQGRAMYRASINDTDWYPSWCEAAYRFGEESTFEKVLSSFVL